MNPSASRAQPSACNNLKIIPQVCVGYEMIDKPTRYVAHSWQVGYNHISYTTGMSVIVVFVFSY